MTDEDREAFSKALASVALCYGEPLSAGRVEAYWQVLQTIPLRAFQQACRDAMASCEFFPRPVRLLKLAGYGMPDVGQLERGIYKALLDGHSDDPLVLLAIAHLGGGRAAGNMTSDRRVDLLNRLMPNLEIRAASEGLILTGPDERPAIGEQKRLLLEERDD